MDINTDLIVAQEFEWVYKNEPTFRVDNKQFTGKVGRTPTGEDIIIKIEIPEFYPIIKPEVSMLTEINHPNVSVNKKLDLQILDEWEPNYRVKDIIVAARRLFIRSQSILERRSTINVEKNKTEERIEALQSEIYNYTSKINDLKSKQLENAGITTAATSALKITKELDLESQILALNDLLYLLELKFEEADIDQTDFFRLFRKYTRELYISQQEINQKEKKNYDEIKKTERSITN